ncbi:trichohyalin, putative [Entamoeba histolytica]
MGITQSTSNNKSNDKTKEIIKQIEELTEKRISNILFDSDKDDWNKDTSVFIQRILNKKYIIIIIEDEEGNRFGGYVSEKIDKVSRIYDSKSFVFSLESNGNIEEMMKFDIIQPEYAFKICNQKDNCLFSFGIGDILVYKENDKTKSWCYQNSFEYEGIENALCGKHDFTPKRIIIIEMK